LGGKGADLAEMTGLGLPVPPGLTVTTEACNHYSSHGFKFPEGLEEEIASKMKVIESKTGRVFGSAENPLLVSVRSGAPISMPGMMDTVLNLGLNDKTVQGLIAQTKNERFAYDSYRRFVQMFGKVVLGIKGEKFEAIIQKHKQSLNLKLDTELDAHTLLAIVQEFKQIVKEETQSEFPADPLTNCIWQWQQSSNHGMVTGLSSIAKRTGFQTRWEQQSTFRPWYSGTSGQIRGLGFVLRGIPQQANRHYSGNF